MWKQYFTFHSKLLDLLVNFSILSLVPELLVTKTNEHINTYQQTWAACNKAVAGKNVKTWSVMSSGICSHTQDILLLAIIHVGKYFISVCIHLQHINIIYHWLINSSLTILKRQLWSAVQSVPITTKVVSLNSAHGEVYSIQHYVIKFVRDLRQVSVFPQVHVLRFPPPIKLTATI